MVNGIQFQEPPQTSVILLWVIQNAIIVHIYLCPKLLVLEKINRRWEGGEAAGTFKFGAPRHLTLVAVEALLPRELLHSSFWLCN